MYIKNHIYIKRMFLTFIFFQVLERDEDDDVFRAKIDTDGDDSADRSLRSRRAR